PRTIKAWTADLHAAIARMVRMRAPVVAAVSGNVAGGSVSLMAAADLVVIAESARISSAFAKIGFSPDSGSTTTVTRRIGVARARRFFLLGETFDAKTALSLGLVDFVVPDGAVQGEAERMARELAAGPTEAYGAIKRLFSQTLDRSLESQLEEEAQTLPATILLSEYRNMIYGTLSNYFPDTEFGTEHCIAGNYPTTPAKHRIDAHDDHRISTLHPCLRCRTDQNVQVERLSAGPRDHSDRARNGRACAQISSDRARP